jgi:hypothetical protein
MCACGFIRVSLKYPTSFLVLLRGTVVVSIFVPNGSRIFSFFFILPLPLLPMEKPSFQGLSNTSNEFIDPSTSTSIYGLNPDIIAMVQSHTFPGAINEEPYNHLQQFKDMCSFLIIPGMTQETLRWKLFSFSLMGRAKQWYIRSVGSMSVDWEKLQVDFCSSFSLLKRINSLPMDILDFEQLEMESLGATWERFLRLLAIYQHLSIPKGVSLYIFLSCLDMKSTRELDIIAGGLFEDKTTKEGREILDIL